MPESFLYFFLWLIFLIIPIVTNNYNGRVSFVKVLYDWLSLLPFILVFFLNNYILLRKILFRGKTYLYAASLLTTVVVISMTFYYLNPVIHKNDPEILENRILQDPQYGREEMMPGIHPDIPANTPAGPELFKQGDNKPSTSRMVNEPGSSMFFLINTVIISLLLAGFNTAIAVTNKWSTEEQARKEIEKEHVESKLAFLQNQVNPHFLMNTLNNIHSLIEVDGQLAQSAVIKLSAMMRYLLYESGRGTTTLQREIEFLKSYLELMQLRVDKSVNVTLELPANFENVSLPPLLFISFIENAFKHGVSYREPSSMKFSLVQHPDSLEFFAENTIPVFQSGKSENTQGGFGLENVRKRLDMLYGTRHRLVIEKTDREFRVNLSIPT
jgi:hypothetical protein